MSEQTRLAMLWQKRDTQKRIVQQVDLTHRQVIGRVPVLVQLLNLYGRQRRGSIFFGLLLLCDGGCVARVCVCGGQRALGSTSFSAKGCWG